MDTDDSRAKYTMGREAFKKGEFDNAIELLEEFSTTHPNFADVYNMLGQAYHSKSDFEKAIKHFEKALEINPRYTDAALNLAVTLFDLGRYEQATEIQKRFQCEAECSGDRLDPYARKKLANMHAEIADVYQGLGMYENAVDEYARALELAPDFPDVRTKLAETYRDQGNHSDAITELKKVKQATPNYTHSRVSLGIIYYTMDRLDEAQAEWDEVLQMEPGHPTVRTYLRMLDRKKKSS